MTRGDESASETFLKTKPEVSTENVVTVSGEEGTEDQEREWKGN